MKFQLFIVALICLQFANASPVGTEKPLESAPKSGIAPISENPKADTPPPGLKEKLTNGLSKTGTWIKNNRIALAAVAATGAFTFMATKHWKNKGSEEKKVTAEHNDKNDIPEKEKKEVIDDEEDA